MDASDLISLSTEFLETYYLDEINEKARKKKIHMVVDFNKISEFNPEMADIILDDPSNSFKALDIGATQIQTSESVLPEFVIRIKNLGKHTSKKINRLREKDIGKVVTLEGMVITKSPVEQFISSAKFECPACGNIIPVLQQLHEKYKEPTRCGCGRKAKFTEVSTDKRNFFFLQLEEGNEEAKSGVEKQKIKVVGLDGLCHSKIERKIYQGCKLKISGIIKERKIEKDGVKKSIIEKWLEANYIEFLQEDFESIIVTEQDKEDFKEISIKDNWTEHLIKEIFDDIIGFDFEKTAVLLQMFGGVTKLTKGARSNIRGTMHILLVGDPGGAKSTMLKLVEKFAPKSTNPVGGAVSAPGLIGALEKDDITGKTGYSAGAIPLGHKGVCIAEGQKILTNKGLVNIETVKINDKIISYDLKNSRDDVITNKISNGVKKVLEIKLFSGDSINCTPDHKILTQKGWVEAQELTDKDYIKIPYINLFEKNKEEIEKGFLFGFGLSDIWYNKSIKKGSDKCIKNSMGFTSSIKNEERSNYVCELLQKEGIKNININTRKKGKSIINNKEIDFQQVKNYKFSDKNLMSKMKDMFEKNKLPGDSNSFYMGFIAGILSTDTSISHKKGKNGIKREICITITRANKKEENNNLKILVQSVLQRFGIYSRIRGNKILITSLRSYNKCLMFKEYIIGRNKEKLYEVKYKKKITASDDLLDEEYNEWFNSIKFKTSETVKKGLHSRIYLAKKNRKVTKLLMETLKKEWSNITNEDYKEPIKNYVLNKIVEIKENGVKEVYDLTIKNNSNFLLPGGLVHNCLIDEMDKIKEEGVEALHGPMTEMMIKITKSIKIELLAETAILAAANPKHGQYSEYDSIYNQISFPPTLVNRFDFVFPIVNKMTREQRKAITKKILRRGKGNELEDIEKMKFYRKYISYGKQLEPTISDELEDYIDEKFELLMDAYEKTSFEDKHIPPVNARTVEAIKRSSEASAKSRHSEIVEMIDIDLACQLIYFCYSKLGVDINNIIKETFTIGNFKETLKIENTSRPGKYKKTSDLQARILTLIREYPKKNDNEMISSVELITIVKSEDSDLEEHKIEKSIEDLKNVGTIFSPKRDKYRVI